MTTVSVSIPARARAYDIVITRGLLTHLGDAIRSTPDLLPQSARLLLVTDATVGALYGEAVGGSLQAAGYACQRFTIPDGEPSKTLAMAEAIYDAALAFGLSRRDAILALGGGVVGDLAGFCAATFYRGTALLQVPTTLLSQIDSSVGGKTAVNFRTVKNGVGAFYQPARVWIDPNALATLDARQTHAGLAEAAKYALLETSATGEDGFFGFLESYARSGAHAPHHPSDDALSALIARCCQIKAQVVAADETERSGLRALLNLGHTFAHALEAATGYTTLLHGEAVAMGLVMALDLSVRAHLLPQTEALRARALLEALSLPLTPPAGLSPEALLALMRQDKKAHGGAIQFVLPIERAGKATLRADIAEAQVLETLREALPA